MSSTDTFRSKGSLAVGDACYEVFRLSAVPGLERLPYSLKVLAENLLRTEDGANVTGDHVRAFARWDPAAQPSTEIQFTPGRVIMQDFTGVPLSLIHISEPTRLGMISYAVFCLKKKKQKKDKQNTLN